MTPICGNCGDGSGWHVWRPKPLPGQRGPLLEWCACADCNDDMQKPKPDLCEGCGETPGDCGCDHDDPAFARAYADLLRDEPSCDQPTDADVSDGEAR